MSFVDGFLAAVPTGNKEAYIATAKEAAVLFKEYGALSYTECWGVDVPDGKVTSFPMAVKLKDDETVVLSWIIWPDRETRDRCMASMETDTRWRPTFENMPFDGQRMVFGGFEPIFEA